MLMIYSARTVDIGDDDDDDDDDNDAGWLSGSTDRHRVTSAVDPRRRDVFLGGSCGSSRWRDEIAVPLLLSVLTAVVLSCDHRLI